MGGSVVFLAVARRALGAGVTFYGGGVAEGRFGMPPLVDLAPGLKTPWLGLFGDEDQGIPVDQVEALRTAAATATVATEIVRYPEAGHGFHCDARPDSFHQSSAQDGWRRTIDWFGDHLARP
jgi:carboxymethylenebutenolidase